MAVVMKNLLTVGMSNIRERLPGFKGRLLWL